MSACYGSWHAQGGSSYTAGYLVALAWSVEKGLNLDCLQTLGKAAVVVKCLELKPFLWLPSYMATPHHRQEVRTGRPLGLTTCVFCTVASRAGWLLAEVLSGSMLSS